MLKRLAALSLAIVLSAGSAQASGAPEGGGSSGPAHLDLAPTGLPVIVGGKIKNYIFVQARLLPAPGADLMKLQEKEPYYRDALVRAAHRTAFNPPGDWTSVDKARFEAVLLAEARRISGPRSFKAAVLLKQTPRKRTGMLQPGTPAR